MAFKKRLECRVFIGYGLVAYTKLLLFLHPYGTTGECASGGAKKKRKRNHGTWHTIRFSVDRLYILCDPLSMLLRQRGRINDESIQNDTIANFSRKGDHIFGTFFFFKYFSLKSSYCFRSYMLYTY